MASQLLAHWRQTWAQFSMTSSPLKEAQSSAQALQMSAQARAIVAACSVPWSHAEPQVLQMWMQSRRSWMWLGRTWSPPCCRQ